MLLATVSQAPYCRGGVRQAIGERIATLFWGMNSEFRRCRSSGVAEWASSERQSQGCFLSSRTSLKQRGLPTGEFLLRSSRACPFGAPPDLVRITPTTL